MTPAAPQETAFRHSGWAAMRRDIFSAMIQCHLPAARLDRFANCGSGCHVMHSPSTNRVKLSANYCHDRLCIPCCSARAAVIAGNLRPLLERRRVRFVTLTLRHSPTSLRSQVDRLLRSFAALRRRGFWKSSVHGGCSCLELKVSDRDGLWHVHLHCLIETPWLDQKRLSEEWHATTGDSSIVDVRAVSRPEEQARYVAKYCAKGTDSSTYRHPEQLAEYIIAIRGRRLITTFGSWRGIDLDAQGDDPADWRSLGSLCKLISLARSGDATSSHILDLVSAKLREVVALGFG